MVGNRRLKVVFFGTPQFAVPTLDRLLESAHEIAGVVTQPDRPRGRGQKPSDAPVKARSLSAGLPILQPQTLKDASVVDAIGQFGADIGVVAAYGKILTQAVLDVPRLGMVNVHASLLPKYRGAAPVHRAVIAGDRETGVTIMRVVKALDAGPMLASVRRPIGDDDTSEEVERGLAELGASLLISTLDRLAEGPVVETPQDDRQSSYAARLTKEDGLVDWSNAARALHDLIRGLHPWPLAFSFLDGRRLILRRSAVVSDPIAEPPGTVVIRGGDLDVATGDGTLRILELQVEGKRAMSPRDFLAGHPIAAGRRFTAHA